MARHAAILSIWTMLLAVCFAGPGMAQPPAPQDEGVDWSLGLGVISAPRPYVGADNDVQAIPLVELRYRRFYVEGIRAGARLLQREDLRLDARAQIVFAGYGPNESPFLAGMQERRETLHVGLGVDWSVGRFELGFGASGDVLGRSDGIEVEGSLTWPKIFAHGRIGLFPSVGLVWQDDDFVDYYAGVRPAEAVPGRPAYEGSAETNADVGVFFFYRFTERWRVVTLLRVQRLGGSYEESPLIDRRWGTFGLIGLTYDF